MVTARAKDLILHHRANSIRGFLSCHGNDNALAECQSVSLDNRGNGRGFEIFQCRLHIVEHFVCRGGNVVFLHQILGKDLAALNDSRIGTGTKARNSLFFQSINRSEHQRVVGCNNRIVDSVGSSKFDDFCNILCTDIHTRSIFCHTTVAGECVNFGNVFIFFEFFDDGVLSAAATDNHNLHQYSPVNSKTQSVVNCVPPLSRFPRQLSPGRAFLT